MFSVGDLVVCVDAGPDRTSVIPLASVREGAVYRVERVFVEPRYRLAIIALCDVVACTGSGGFNPARFRKVDRTDEQFTAQIRACRDAHSKSPEPVA